MYCKNCGKEMKNGAAVCLECGAAKSSGSKFCVHCGSGLPENAKVCIKCGYSTRLSAEASAEDKEAYCTSCGEPMKALQEICLSCGAKNGSGKRFCRSCGNEVKEGAQVCLKCGCAPFGSGSGQFSADKLVEGLKNVNVDKIKDGINNLDTSKITEHKYSKYFGIVASALVIITYLLPFFNANMTLGQTTKTETMNGFSALFGMGQIEANFFVILPLLFVVFQIVAQFLKPLEKYKTLSNLIGGGGCFLTLIIAAITEGGKSPSSIMTIIPGFGFFVAVIVSLALAGLGLIRCVKKK